MRLLHLFWPHLPLRLARHRWERPPHGLGTEAPSPRHPTRPSPRQASGGQLTSEPFPTGPVVLGGQPWTDATVIDANPAALALGVSRGLPLGSAHRFAPDAVFLDPEPEADAAVLTAALERLDAFSPGVAGDTDVRDPTFGLLEVQIDGLELLWGAEPALVERIVGALAPILPGRPRVGIAGTRFAATLAAALAPTRQGRSVPPGEEAAFLAPLPATLLSPDQEVRARLMRFGLKRIGQVAELPRSALVARFGPEGERLRARARGVEISPFKPRQRPDRLLLALPLEPAVEALEPLRFVLHRLAGALAEQLVARGAAATRAHLRLQLDPAFARRGTLTEHAFEQRFPEPTSEAEAIERLLFAQLERTPPPAAVARMELELVDVGPAAGHQLPLFVPQAARSARLAWQLARLALTYGEDRIRRVELVDPEAPVPEARWRWIPIESGAGPIGTGARPAEPDRRAAR